MELHHQAIVDAHACDLDQHVAGETAGVLGAGLALQRPLEDRLGLGVVERRGKSRLGSVIGGGGSHAFEEGPPVFQRTDERIITGNVDAAGLAQCRQICASSRGSAN